MNDIPIPYRRRDWELILMGAIGAFIVFIFILVIIVIASATA